MWSIFESSILFNDADADTKTTIKLDESLMVALLWQRRCFEFEMNEVAHSNYLLSLKIINFQSTSYSFTNSQIFSSEKDERFHFWKNDLNALKQLLEYNSNLWGPIGPRFMTNIWTTFSYIKDIWYSYHFIYLIMTF